MRGGEERGRERGEWDNFYFSEESGSLQLTLVTVMKSCPKKTPLTPSILNICLARGEPRADMGLGKSSVPDSSTGTPGMNLRLLGFGVSCTWINMLRARNENMEMRSS